MGERGAGGDRGARYRRHRPRDVASAAARREPRRQIRGKLPPRRGDHPRLDRGAGMSTAVTEVPEPGLVAKLLRDIARVEVLPRFRQLKSHEIREKSPGDFVTVADEAMEAALAPKLAALLPGSLLVGEEDCARDPSVMRRLASDQPVWVIDPVDGTANFAEGKEEFCTMMALVERDQVLGGWIYDPVTDTTSYAVKGGGVWSAGKRLAPPATPNQYRGVVSVGYKGPKEVAQHVNRRRDRVQQV